MNKIIWIISIMVMSFSLLACGGSSGGSSGNNVPLGTPPASQTSGNGAVTITKTSLVFNETTPVSALFKKTDGTAAAGITVTFSTTLGVLTPATAVTDANGIATVQMTVGTISGQGQVTVSATVDGKLVTNNALYSVNLPPLHLTPISLGLTNLSYGGSTSVSVEVRDASNNLFTTQDVDVVFTSTQTASGKATINTPVRTINGVATTTYQATTATGVDVITASIAGSSVNANVTVAALSASSIQFISASPSNIGLKGMGGAGIQETSVVTFRVLNTAGQPKANQQVDFSLNTSIGGLSLLSSSGSTAADGTVSVIVQSGTIATTVRVTATITGTSPVISTQSDQLVVSTGVPAQDGFSISIATLNPEAWNIDGVTDIVSARLSDHFHNPVPNGTAVYFTTSSGVIQPSCTTTGGACSVTWTSQDPRPVNGRARILAYAVGEEAFLDINGSGLADAGEFTDTTEAFRDDNENGVRDANETFIDFNSDGIFNGPDGKYNGVLQGAASVGAPKSKHIYSNATLVMASSAALITTSCPNPIPVALGGSNSCTFTVSDINGNTMPAGTNVTFTYTSVVPGITLIADSYRFPNSTAKVGSTLPIIVTDGGSGTTPVGRGVVKVSVTSPGGLITTANISVN